MTVGASRQKSSSEAGIVLNLFAAHAGVQGQHLDATGAVIEAEDRKLGDDAATSRRSAGRDLSGWCRRG